MKLHTRNILGATLMSASLLSVASWPSWAENPAFETAPPGGNFKPINEVTDLPHFIPGMGTLYVNPDSLPVGPFLGYDREGRLVNVIFMIPLKELQAQKDFIGLGESLAGVKVNHVDAEYNPGHPGVAEPHYHFTLWFISPEEKAERLK